MATRILAVALAASLALVLVGCAPPDGPPTEVPNGNADVPDDAARLAPGLYELEGDTMQAIGMLAWVDLEGGFWAVVDPAAEVDEAANIAVIANGDELHDVLAPLEGRAVSIVGERFDGVSIRMAGPEIVAEVIEPIDDDMPGAAE